KGAEPAFHGNVKRRRSKGTSLGPGDRTRGTIGRGAGEMSVHVSHEAFEVGAGLFKALRHTGVTIVYQDPELRTVWAENVPRAWAEGDVSGLTDADFLPDDAAGQLTTAKRAVLRSGRMETLEIGIPDRHGTRWFDVWIDADRQDDAVAGIVTT